MSRTVLDNEMDKLRFELVLQGYAHEDIARLRSYLCDLRHVMLGLAAMRISPRALPCQTDLGEWTPMSVLTYQDIKLLASYAKDPASADVEFLYAIFATTEASRILDVMIDLYSIKSGIMQQDFTGAHEEKYVTEAKAFLNFFKGSLPDVTYCEY